MKQERQKLVKFVFLLLILIALISAAVYVIQGTLQNSTRENKLTWKTYSNEMFHFTMEYPEDWSVTEESYSITIAKDDTKNVYLNGIDYKPSLRIVMRPTDSDDIDDVINNSNSDNGDGVVLGIGIVGGTKVGGIHGFWTSVCGEGSFDQGPMFIKDSTLFSFRTPNPCLQIKNSNDLKLMAEYIKTDSLYRPAFDKMIESFKFTE